MSNSRYYGSEEETENHNFTVTVEDLKEVTKYYYRFLVWNRNYVDNKFEMEKKNFVTNRFPTWIVMVNIGRFHLVKKIACL